jgi:signal transduction histidine kinase/ligand-binding sensor domain-containing protein/DNA-binding response OmpR family regulator
MIWRIIKYLTFIVWCFVAGSLSAQPNQYKFKKIDINQGLSHNQINTIYRDSKGFMWFGTMSGLNRFDGYNFKVFKHSIEDTTTISDNFITGIIEDDEGKLWVNTRSEMNVFDPQKETFSRELNKYLKKFSCSASSFLSLNKDKQGNIWVVNKKAGIYKYDISSKKTTNIAHRPNDTTSLYSNEISTIEEDYSGNYWTINRSGILEKIDGKTNSVVYRNFYLYNKYKDDTPDYKLFIDKDNDVWIYITSDPGGLFFFKVSDKSMLHIHKDALTCKLNTNSVRSIVQDEHGIIWIGTDHGGINLLDKKDFSIRYLLNNPDDDKSISQNSIVSMYKDKFGIIWVGSYKKGVNYYHKNLVKFQLFKHQTLNPNSLSYDDVSCFAEDDKQNLWIGTNGGGLVYFDRKQIKYTSFVHKYGSPNSLSNDIIISLFIDSKKNLWIGTYYGGLCMYDGKRFKTFKHNPLDSKSISDDRVWRIYEDSRKNLWIGTLGGGLELFDRKKEVFYHYRVGDVNSVQSKFVVCFREDTDGNLWIGTAEGIDLLNRQTGRFIHYDHESNDPSSLSNRNVIDIIEDSRKLIWIGTREGLNLFNKTKGAFRTFRDVNGLPDNAILSMVEDDSHNLWVSTPNGLSNIIVKKDRLGEYSFEFKNYDESDGLQGKEFNENAVLKTKQGELIFGGANGFNIFQPRDIKINKDKPDVAITDFVIFNKSVKVNEKIDGRVILQKAINESKEIVLKYSENIFTIEFAALNYIHPEKNKYSYMLEGFNKDWMKTDGRNRKATYTNLNPGTYTFKVKASNNDGYWNEEGSRLTITILPPFWKTKTAFLLYILIILGALLLSRKILLERERLNFKIDQERMEAQRNHELDVMKIKFFTNISHEFRTPLTLIITPLEKILKQTKDPDQKKQFDLIYRNARRLLNLVNQLLDFRRMEVQEIKLNPSRGDIIGFIKEISYSFSDISEKKNIQFSFQSSITELDTVFDQDKLEKILFNLLSNAFKFTPEHGKVSVEIRVLDDQPEIISIKENDELKWLEIKVRDTGIGISSEKHEKIFERFFQNDLPGGLINQGSGIGLAITKEFVKLHGGSISVESEPEQGSCFTIWLPIKDLLHKVSETLITEHIQTVDHSNANLPEFNENNKKPILLLVEDNEEFRFYLKDNLKNEYNIAEASNGLEGWKQATSIIPDLIVSDIMMPEMNGIDFCKKVKNDQRTSHIPIILLTARNAEEQKLEGLQSGADDYITKPFNFEILELRIKNLVSHRDLLRKSFQKQIVVNPSEISVTSLDEKLIKKALEIVEVNISNPDFSVEELSKELGMSRVHLYKKLLSLTGKTPIEFIRVIRLKRAAQLLEKSQLTVSEIAYQVGFNNPKYFTKYFKSEFNTLPSLYVAGKQKEENI